VVEAHGLTRAIKTGDLESWLEDFYWGAVSPSIKSVATPVGVVHLALQLLARPVNDTQVKLHASLDGGCM